MEENIKSIDKDLLLSTLNFAKKKTLVITVAYFISIIFSVLGFAPIFIGVFIGGVFDIGNQFNKIFSAGFFQNGGIILILFILFAVVVVLYVFAWFINFSLLQLNDYVLKKESSLSAIVSLSISSKTLKTFFLLFTFFIINVLIFAPLIFFILLEIGNELFFGITFFISFFLLVILNLKFCLAFPLVLLQNSNIFEAIVQSSNAISFLTTLKYIFIFILVLIGIGTVFFIFTKIASGLLTQLGSIGLVLNFIFQIFVNGFLASLIFSFVICLYYDHLKPKMEENLDLDDNFIL